MKKTLYLLNLIFFTFFFNSCGYTPIFLTQDSKFVIEKEELQGNKELALDFVNNIKNVQSNSGENKKRLILIVDVKKEKTSSVKDVSGKTTTYKLEVIAETQVKDFLNNELIYSDIFSASLNFENQDQMSDTLRLESIVTQNLLKKLSNDFILRINKFIKPS